MHEQVPAAGDLIWIRRHLWRVDHARRLVAVVRLDVSGRAGRRTFLAPFDRWRVEPRRRRPRRVRRQRALAMLAGLTARSHGVNTLVAAVGARIAILSYQLEPALALRFGARRVLIADEVGLGKTIQAGLAIAEILRRDPDSRVLVVTPFSLAEQWRAELERRFGIDSTVADAAALERLTREMARGERVWSRTGVWIASPDFLKQPHVEAALPDLPWDLVAIDEAHGAAGDSDRHRACDVIARRSRRVVLMTATPHTGDEQAFRRLTNLGRLDDASDSLVVFRRTRSDVGLNRTLRVRWGRVRLSYEERRVLDVLLDFERAVLRAADRSRRDAALLFLAVLRKRSLSTMSALGASLDRRLAWLDGPERAAPGPDYRQPRLAFDEESDEIGAREEAALCSDFGLSPGHERSWLRRLRSHALVAVRRDTKVRYLARLVRRASEPVVIFTEFRHSLEVVTREIGSMRNTAVLHGGLSPAERRSALARFLSGAATALVATDVAGQGLNLHDACRWVINLELPWNPARLEQRAGRVDRIGQRRPVHVTLLAVDHDAEAAMLRHLARRALSASRALGPGLLSEASVEEARLRWMVLTGEAPRAAGGVNGLSRIETEPVALCTRWRRPARAVARQLESRRRLNARWRGDDRGTRRPAVCLSSQFELERLASGWLLIFEVPIVDGTGAVVERHIVAAQTAVSPIDGRLDPGVLAAACACVEARMSARVARLGRQLAGRRVRECEHERAIGRALAASRRAGTQSGLFDRREAAAIEAANITAAGITANVDARLWLAEKRAAVRAGAPTLVLVLGAGR